VLTVADALLSEYGWSLDYVLHDLPLQQAFALYAAIAARYGGADSGPTFEDLDLIDDLEQFGLPKPTPSRPRRRRKVKHEPRG